MTTPAINVANLSKPYLSELSCVVLLSVLPQSVGKIVKVSQKFESVTKIFSNAESLGKNINFLLSHEIADAHEDLMDSFLRYSDVNEVHSKPFVLGIDQFGFAVPFSI